MIVKFSANYKYYFMFVGMASTHNKDIFLYHEISDMLLVK